LGSTDYRSQYVFKADDNKVTKGRYEIPNFMLKRKEERKK